MNELVPPLTYYKVFVLTDGAVRICPRSTKCCPRSVAGSHVLKGLANFAGHSSYQRYLNIPIYR